MGRATLGLVLKSWHDLPNSIEQMRLAFARRLCDAPIWRRLVRRTISRGSPLRLLYILRCQSSKFRVDARASPQVQSYVPVVTSTALPVESLADSARLILFRLVKFILYELGDG